MLCLWYLQCTNIWNRVQSNALRNPAPLFCIRPISPLFSHPSSKTTARFRSCCSFSQLTGWHTFQRTKSLSEKTQENTLARTHMGTQVHACNLMQTHGCAMGCRHNLHTHQYTSECMHKEANLHTHKHTLPKSSSVMPSHPTLDKPLCEPDKAGEGTQQPLNTGAGCISKLSVPADRIHILNCRALYPVLCDSDKAVKELYPDWFVIWLLIDCWGMIH